MGFVARATAVYKTDGSSNTTMTINNPVEATAGRIGVFVLHCNSVLNPNSLTLDGNVIAISNNFGVNGNFALHSSLSYRVFTGSDPASYTFTIGGDTRDDALELLIFDEVNSASPIGAVGAFTSNTLTSHVNGSITTTAPNSDVLVIIGTKDGSQLTATDSGYPTGTTGISSKRSRNNSSGVNSGFAYQRYASSGSATGTKTWSSYLAAARYGSTISIELKTLSATLSITGSITTATGKAFTTAGLSAVTGVTVATSGAGSIAATFSWAANSGTLTVPIWSDATVYPYFGSVTVTVTDGTLTPNTSSTLAIQSGYAAVTFASVALTDSTWFGKYFYDLGNPLLDGDRCYYQTTNNLVIYPDGFIQIDQLTTVQLAIHRAADFKTYTYTLALSRSNGASRAWIGIAIGI